MKRCLLDTHAMVFWSTGENMSAGFRAELDDLAGSGGVFVSSVSFWELALLARKGWVEIVDVAMWKDRFLELSGAILIDPSADEMIASAFLPLHHRDPFDRLLVTQAMALPAALVSRDACLPLYGVDMFWMD
ncbi:MAG: type II toxin-antitoxin system VapC family toxin [Desulfovibrionaceae bacterium]|nr:type II toxin-antitoxin system VapC family toxin [Desulfovibrionaceae bacterium]